MHQRKQVVESFFLRYRKRRSASWTIHTLLSQLDLTFTTKYLPTFRTLAAITKIILVCQTDWARVDRIIIVVGGGGGSVAIVI
jgi:hypothetical protein